MSISNNLFSLLEYSNKKPVELSKTLGINQSIITGWKNRNADPPAKYIMKIAEFLEVDPIFLLTGIEQVNDNEKSEGNIDSLISPEEFNLILMYRELAESNQAFIYNAIKQSFELEMKRKADKDSKNNL